MTCWWTDRELGRSRLARSSPREAGATLRGTDPAPPPTLEPSPSKKVLGAQVRSKSKSFNGSDTT